MSNSVNVRPPRPQDQFLSDFLNSSDSSSESDVSLNQELSSSVTDIVLEQRIIDALRDIYDPEIPVNIYDLGLIYSVDIDDEKVVRLEMTLTTPGCPVAQTFPGTVECAVRCVEGVADAHVNLVWDPPWTKEKMTEDALLMLGLL